MYGKRFYQFSLITITHSLNRVIFTKKITNLEIYLGCENILNFRQENPITNWENPFSEEFNILNIWGPTKGREVYLGLRLSI